MIGEQAVLTRTLTAAGLTVRPVYVASLTANGSGPGLGFAVSGGLTITFDFIRPPSAATLQTGDLVVTNLATDQRVDPARFSVVTTDGTSLVSWRYDSAKYGQLPDGNYRAVLTERSVGDAAGQQLVEEVAVDFFVLAGDANRDRVVNFIDLLALAKNYNGTGKAIVAFLLATTAMSGVAQWAETRPAKGRVTRTVYARAFDGWLNTLDFPVWQMGDRDGPQMWVDRTPGRPH